MVVRENSVKAYNEEEFKLHSRSELVLEVIKGQEGLTSRQIVVELGFSDVNSVRPRLTELLKAKLIQEGKEKIKCEVTNKSVATYYLRDNRREEWDVFMKRDNRK